MHSSPGNAPPDISRFLKPLSSHDLKHMRMLAALCGATYYMGSQVTPRAMRRRHRLELVTTSLACELIKYEHVASAREVSDDGDGCCLSVADASAIYGDRAANDAAGAAAAAAAAPGPSAALSNVVPFSRSLVGSGLATAQQLQPVAADGDAVHGGGGAAAAVEDASPAGGGRAGGGWNPADLVAAKLGEAAAAASAAALAPLASAASAASAAALGPLASAAGSLYAGGLGLVSSRLFPAGAAPAPLPLPDRLAGATIAGIAGMEVASSHPNGGEVKAASTSSGSACPSEWFVADDPRTHTRYFVIQGSDSLDHWKTNLLFEPVVFENPTLGIKVHRGAYEAACALYDRFLPLVQEQVHIHPLAKVSFTGHSIGGSMATLLSLMFRLRGVLRAEQIGHTVTFGSPAIFCARARGSGGSGSSCGGCSGGCAGCASACASVGGASGGGGGAGAGGDAGLLRRLGLGEGAVRNVIMTRDIVPRAFACDYSLVADILRSWGPNWRDHNCLNWQSRKQMFVHIGRTVVLQPGPELRFAASEPPLPLLPPGGGAYELAPPTLAARMRAAAARGAAAREGRRAGREAACVDEALAALMDSPHPLETLGDPGAYLDSGTISRYHNPDNYCRALGRVLAGRRVGAQVAAPRRGAGARRDGAARAAQGAWGRGAAAAADVVAVPQQQEQQQEPLRAPSGKVSAR